jgi:hypothetical protein
MAAGRCPPPRRHSSEPDAAVPPRGLVGYPQGGEQLMERRRRSSPAGQGLLFPGTEPFVVDAHGGEDVLEKALEHRVGRATVSKQSLGHLQRQRGLLNPYRWTGWPALPAWFDTPK